MIKYSKAPQMPLNISIYPAESSPSCLNSNVCFQATSDGKNTYIILQNTLLVLTSALALVSSAKNQTEYMNLNPEHWHPLVSGTFFQVRFCRKITPETRLKRSCSLPRLSFWVFLSGLADVLTEIRGWRCSIRSYQSICYQWKLLPRENEWSRNWGITSLLCKIT